MKRYLTLAMSFAMILCLFAGCGASSQSGPGEMSAERNSADLLTSGESADPQALPENRKWVITSEVRAEAEDMDALLHTVLEKVSQLEGYIENQSVYNGSGSGSYRSAELKIRVPAERMDAFLKTVKQSSNVTSVNRNLEDITLQYVDTETRLEALRTEEERLMELMEQAETVADLLEIESRLTDVHYELENVTSRLKTYDNQVNYATITLFIEEVREYTPVEEPGFLDRISVGFVSSLKGVGRSLLDLLVFLIVASPYLVVWGLIILGIVLLIRLLCRKNAAKRKKPAGEPEVLEQRKHSEPLQPEAEKKEKQNP